MTDEQVASVITYLQSLDPLVSPARDEKGGLTPAAERGKKIFQSESARCSECHPEPLYTDLKMHDVGTAGENAKGLQKMDTPTLVELWRSAPYGHLGEGATLREFLVDQNTEDRHGTVSDLTTEQVDDLLEYIHSL